jgi:hypothetical protein
MNNEKVGRLLQRFPGRGLILFRLLWLGSLIGFGLLPNLILLSNASISWGWVFAVLLLGLIAFLAWSHARKQFFMARLVAEDPMIVYWAHAAGRQGPDLETSVDNCSSLTLHLRVGRQLDVQLPVPQMRELNAWLSEKNPDIRWGHYAP